MDTCWRPRGIRLRMDQTRVHLGCPGNRPSLLRSCRLLSIPGLTGTHCPALRRHAFRSLTPCHPFLQIRLNSRGLIYSVGLLLASVFVTVGLQLSPLSSSHVPRPPPATPVGSVATVCLDTRWTWPSGRWRQSATRCPISWLFLPEVDPGNP